MSQINQDILASHKIISIMETARRLNEETLSQLPDIMMSITRDGRILKINNAGAKHFGIGRELILGVNFSQLFQRETWNIFQSKLAYIVRPEQLVDFELPLDENPNKRTFFYWTVSMVRQEIDGREGIFSVIGRDISALRKYERSLAEMFSNIPLGILTIGADCKIETPYFAYCEHLLSRPSLEGASLLEVLFAPCMSYLSSEQKEGVSNLGKFYESEFSVFQAIVESFPKRLEFPIQTSTGPDVRYLGITYQPIVYRDRVRRLMIVLEDRTSIVKFERDQEERELRDSRLIKRILQIKKSDRELLPFMIADTSNLLKLCKEALETIRLDAFCNRLHGVKGNANMAGFFGLVDICHSLEKSVLSGEAGIEQAKLRFTAIEQEWAEYISLYNAMESKSLLELQPKTDTLRMLERKFSHQVQTLAAKLGKRAKLEFSADNVKFSDQSLAVFNEVCVHLINNSIDHGIEKPDERILRSKDPSGIVKIVIKGADGGHAVEISDDGRGISIAKIRAKAKERGLLNSESVLSDEKIADFIFAREFSTAENVSEVSGRGIGLDAVRSRLEEIGGWIKVLPTANGLGTRFILFFKDAKSAG